MDDLLACARTTPDPGPLQPLLNSCLCPREGPRVPAEGQAEAGRQEDAHPLLLPGGDHQGGGSALGPGPQKLPRGPGEAVRARVALPQGLLRAAGGGAPPCIGFLNWPSLPALGEQCGPGSITLQHGLEAMRL